MNARERHGSKSVVNAFCVFAQETLCSKMRSLVVLLAYKESVIGGGGFHTGERKTIRELIVRESVS